MKTTELKEKTTHELQDELKKLFKEQFDLRVQKAIGEKPKAHLFKKLRKNIARIKTVLTYKAKAYESK